MLVAVAFRHVNAGPRHAFYIFAGIIAFHKIDAFKIHFDSVAHVGFYQADIASIVQALEYPLHQRGDFFHLLLRQMRIKAFIFFLHLVHAGAQSRLFRRRGHFVRRHGIGTRRTKQKSNPQQNRLFHVHMQTPFIILPLA